MTRVLAGYNGKDDTDTALVRRRIRTCRGRNNFRKTLAMLAAKNIRHANMRERIFMFDETEFFMSPSLYGKEAAKDMPDALNVTLEDSIRLKRQMYKTLSEN